MTLPPLISIVKRIEGYSFFRFFTSLSFRIISKSFNTDLRMRNSCRGLFFKPVNVLVSYNYERWLIYGYSVHWVFAEMYVRTTFNFGILISAR